MEHSIDNNNSRAYSAYGQTLCRSFIRRTVNVIFRCVRSISGVIMNILFSPSLGRSLSRVCFWVCFIVSPYWTYMHARIQACKHTLVQAYMHTYLHARARTHTCTHIYTRTRTGAHMHTHIHTCTFTRNHSHTHAHTHTNTHTHTHTHTHTMYTRTDNSVLPKYN